MKKRILKAWRRVNPVSVESAEGAMFYIPEEISFPPEEEYLIENSPLYQALIESLSKPLEPECPLCHEERKQYACIFPLVPCPHVTIEE